MTSGRRKGLETHLKRIAAKGIATELAVQAPAESVLGGKTAFKDKYRNFFSKRTFLAILLTQVQFSWYHILPRNIVAKRLMEPCPLASFPASVFNRHGSGTVLDFHKVALGG